jgi:hypothetical protein
MPPRTTCDRGALIERTSSLLLSRALPASIGACNRRGGCREENASLIVLEKCDPIFFKHRAGQFAGCECAGIQVYPIVVYLRLAYRCVAVNHNLSEASLVVKKIVSYPQKVSCALVGQIDAGPHARVYEEIIPQSEAERQREQKSVVMSRQPIGQLYGEPVLGFGGTIEGGLQSIGAQRFQSAEVLPVSKDAGILQELQQERLVISLQTNRAIASA